MQPKTTIDTTAKLGADAPELKSLQEEAFSLIMKLSEGQLLIALNEVFKREEK